VFVSKAPPLLQINRLHRLMVGPLSLVVDEGDCLCISGASGCGKSLLLRAIADLDPHEGQVLLQGVPATAIEPQLWRSHIGLLPPESHWWLPQVKNHFHKGLPMPLEQLGISDDILEQQVARLSSGERQRLALMRLLSNRPRVLLLDEPTANLDHENTRRVEDVITAYRRENKAAVIWVSHDLDQVARVANRHYEMRGGDLHTRDLEGQQWLS
jgi:ABC-type iron transport system FetAB ATPase subunit